MFDVETNHQHTGKALLQFLLQRFVIIRIVTVAEHSCHFQFRLLILDDVDSAESYHTAEERSDLQGWKPLDLWSLARQEPS